MLRPRLFTDMSQAVSDYRCRSAYVRNAAADRICSIIRGRAQRTPSQGRALRLGVPLTWRAIERRIEEEGVEQNCSL